MKNALLWLEDHKDWGIEMLRMYLGVVLILKGFYFIRDMNSLLALIGLQSSLWLGGIFAHYIVDKAIASIVQRNRILDFGSRDESSNLSGGTLTSEGVDMFL